MNTLDTILSRCTCRAYTDEQITDEELEKLLIAANAAPVGMGAYDGIHLTILQNKEVMGKIETAVAKAMPDLQVEHALYNAPTCIVVSVKDEVMHALSASCVMENILLEATELGLGSAYLMLAASISAPVPELCAAMGISEGYKPIAMAAVGHSAMETKKKEPVTDKLACVKI